MEKIFDTERIAGKRILITGGTTGIGRALAIRFAELGANVIIVGRHQEAIEDTLNAIKYQDAHSQILGVSADMSLQEDIEKVFHTVREELGGLDILINNAGLGYGSITEGEYEDWDYVVKTNLMGYMACAHYAYKEMVDIGKGNIILVGSMSADVRDEGSSVYVATKSALRGFAASFRKEVNPNGIHVTLIEPGAVDTDMQDQPHDEKLEKIDKMEMLMADDIAQSVIYVLSQHERTSVVELKIKPLKQII